MGLSTILAMNFREGREGITGVTNGSGIRALSQSEAMEAPQAGFLGLASNILTMFVHRATLIDCRALDYERRHLMSLRQGTVATGGQLPVGNRMRLRRPYVN